MERILILVVVSLSFLFPGKSVADICFDFSHNKKIGLEDSILAMQVLSEMKDNDEGVELLDLIRVLQIVSGDDVNVNSGDTDRDGKIDCKDNCPYDSTKTDDIDTDGDGIIDCNDPCPEDPDKNKYCLVWSDEFDSDTLIRDNWRFETGDTGWGNAELQYYTDRPENIQIVDGHLVITARQEEYKDKQWTSSRITTAGLHSFKYGKIEARMRLPNGPGIWPAFWMLGDSFFRDGWPRCGEIDITETGLKDDIANGVDDRTTHATVHWASPEGDHWDFGQSLTTNQPFDEDFHIFGIEWDDKKIFGYVDGKIYFTFDISKSDTSVEEFHDHFYLILNLAVGGDFTGITEENKEQIDGNFPHSVHVDWVRVYQRAGQVHIQGDATFNFPPSGGNFVIYKDLYPNPDKIGQIALDVNAKLKIWNNLTECPDKTPLEGANSICFTGDAGDWAGFGILAAYPRNLCAYGDGYLHFALKTNSPVPFKIGIKSGEENAKGESWLYFNGSEIDPFEFMRDGKWHEINAPLSDFQRSDFSQIDQLFMMAADTLQSEFSIEIDDIYYIDNDRLSNTCPDFPDYNHYVVFSETTGGKAYYRFDIDGKLQAWQYSDLIITENTSSYEGDKAWEFRSESGKWFGAGISLYSPRDMKTFSSGYLRFALKTSSNVVFRIGIKSGDSEGWVTFDTDSDLYGFTRDGNWHSIVIPLQHFNIALDSVNQLFMISANEGNLPVSSFSIEVDDLYWAFGDQ